MNEDIIIESKNHIKKKKHKINVGFLELLLMCLPAALVIFFINYIPMFGIIVAFKNYRIDKGFFGSDWIGLKNFEFLFGTEDAWRITRNTIGLNAIFIFVGLIISVAFALMLNEITKRALIKFYQTVMFFPFFLSWVVVGYALYAYLNMNIGIVNTFLKNLGMEGVAWYSEPKYWPFILAMVFLWKNTGYYCIIYYAGLMGIDNEYYEAAALDGASKLQMVRHISIPMISPLITIMVLLQIGRILYADFGMFYNTTMDSGPLYPTTDVIDTYVFRSFRLTGEVGLASAAGFYQSVVGFILVALSNFLVKRKNPENALF